MDSLGSSFPSQLTSRAFLTRRQRGPGFLANRLARRTEPYRHGFVDLGTGRHLRWRQYDGLRVAHRADDFALPHPREVGRRRDGCGVQGRGYPAPSQRRP